MKEPWKAIFIMLPKLYKFNSYLVLIIVIFWISFFKQTAGVRLGVAQIVIADPVENNLERIMLVF